MATVPDGNVRNTESPATPASRRRLPGRTPRAATVGIFVLGILYTLHLARALLVPISIAILLFFMLSPVVRMLRKLRIPEALSAALLLVVFAAVTGYGVSRLAGPAQEWIGRAPQTMRQLESKMRNIREPVEEVSQAAKQMEQITSPDGGKTPRVVVQEGGLLRQLFGGTVGFVSAFLIVMFLTYFLLATGEKLLRKIIGIIPAFDDKKRAVSIARDLERQVSAYLATVTIIYAGVGSAVALAAWLVGLPNPLLWGALAMMFNYIPFAGAVGTFGVLFIVGLLTFDGLGRALIAPAAFAGINLLESYIVTPIIVGRRLILNPLAVILGVLLWGFLWGLPGVFMAIPMVASFKIFCDHVEALKPLGELLGG